MKPFLERINDQETILSDGAFGTMLMEKGLQSGECPENLNITNPEWIEEIACRYVEAGAEIIHSCTFGSSPLKLMEYGLDDETEEINKTAVSIIRQAAGDRAYVSASIGPSGKILKPYGDLDAEELYKSFERQLKSVFSAGVDLVTVETMTDLNEAVTAVRAVKDVSPETPVIATMTFDDTPKGFYTIMGVGVKEAAAGLEEAGADIIGSNCGNGLDNMIEIAGHFKKATSLPIIIQSNAGNPLIKDGEVHYPETPDYFARKVNRLVDAGVSIIGGCCGTTPEHLEAIRLVLKN